MSQSWALVLVAGITLATGRAAELLRRWLTVPVGTLELIAGFLVGPGVLGWVWDGDVLDVLSQAGLAMMIFLAGYEIDCAAGRGALRDAGWAWAAGMVLGLSAVVLGYGGGAITSATVALALTGTMVNRQLPGPGTPHRFRTALAATGAVGTIAPMAGAAVLASWNAPWNWLIAGLTAVAVGWVARPRPRRAEAMAGSPCDAHDGDRGDQVRSTAAWMVLLLAALVWLAQATGHEALLAAFPAGLMARSVAGSGRQRLPAVADAVGYGFLVPVACAVIGINLAPFAAVSLAVVPLTVLLYLVTRGCPVALFAPREWPAAQRMALALHGATAWPTAVVVSVIAMDEDRLPAGTASALIAAAVLTALVFPAMAERLQRRGLSRRKAPPADASTPS